MKHLVVIDNPGDDDPPPDAEVMRELMRRLRAAEETAARYADLLAKVVETHHVAGF